MNITYLTLYKLNKLYSPDVWFTADDSDLMLRLKFTYWPDDVIDDTFYDTLLKQTKLFLDD